MKSNIVNKIENYLNIIHYCLYKVDCKLRLWFDKINPVWILLKLLYKIPFIKRQYEKKGVTIQDISNEVNKLSSNKRYGFSIIFAGGFHWSGLWLFFFSVMTMLKVALSIALFVGCALVSGFICYVFVFKEDKYIVYFRKYGKWSKQEKRKYGWLTLGSIFFVVFSFFLSLELL